ncbi:MAG: HD domain-containing protein [Desulfuromonadales bacterium]|nr:HD domain-containing protein [Desulfuromonadales bacterium]
MTGSVRREKELYNSRIIDTYIKLLKKRYPDVKISEIFNYAGMKGYEVADQAHWFTQEQIDRFYEKTVELTGNEQIAREAGRYSATPEAMGAMRQYILGMVGPTHAFKLVRRTSSKFTRSTLFDSRSLAANRVEVTVTPLEGVVEKPFQCENRIGIFEAVCLMFNNQLPQIEQPECVFKNSDRCRYIITWKKQASTILKRTRNASVVVLGGACAAASGWVPELTLTTLLPVSSVLVLALALAAQFQEKRELSRSLNILVDSSEKLIEQMNLNYSNALITNEIGQAISAPTAVDEILGNVVQVLDHRLDFDRGMILLADEDRSHLVFRIGFGYSNEQLKTLNSIAFNLSKTESKGVFVVAFHEQTPFLVDDVQNLEDDLSHRSLDLIQMLQTHSFICCPIICEGASIGILAVDNIKSNRLLVHSDVSLLMGIAPVLGISIRNADLLLSKELQFQSTLQVLAASIDARDPLTAGHSEKVTEYVSGICEALTLSEEEQEQIRVASLLHDYGKIGVPDAILKKEGRLTDKEYDIVKTHAETTRSILSQINFEGIYRQVPEIAGAHHENIDGSGYPDGLQGKEIPFGARIISVADFFEAITSQRHYRGPMPEQTAYQLLREQSGKKFDPTIVEAFISYHQKGKPPEGGFGGGGGGRASRVPWQTTASLRFNSHASIGTIEDISTRGAFVGLEAPIKEGTVIHITFSLPGTETPPIEAVAKVVWTNLDDRRAKPNFPQGNGLEFTGLNEQSEQILNDFVSQTREAESLH